MEQPIDHGSSPRGRQRKGIPAQRPSDAIVDTLAAVSQDSSPLFTLPPELRHRIYELVLGTGTIHLSGRDCTPSKRDLGESSGLDDLGDLDDSVVQRKTVYEKSTYAICKNPDWDSYYRQSKRSIVLPAECYEKEPLLGSPPRDDGSWENIVVDISPGLVVNFYPSRHSRCDHPILDFEAQDYARRCSKDLMHFNAKDQCDKCRKLKDQLTREYGAPTEGGLLKLHADSKLDLSLLLVCRQIYKEAALLPYALYTFDMIGSYAARQFANRTLTSRQVRAVRKVRICHMVTVEDLTLLVSSFPCLRKLDICMDYFIIAKGGEKLWSQFFLHSQLQFIEIVWGPEKSRYCVDNRLKRRTVSELMERFLMSASFEVGYKYLKACRRALRVTRTRFQCGPMIEEEDDSDGL